jgi:hypothetical protein
VQIRSLREALADSLVRTGQYVEETISSLGVKVQERGERQLQSAEENCLAALDRKLEKLTIELEGKVERRLEKKIIASVERKLKQQDTAVDIGNCPRL